MKSPFRIDEEEDTTKSSAVLVLIAFMLTALGAYAEWSGINGALVASAGVVVAVTTPIFTSVLSQMSDYSSAVRQLLFHYRAEKHLGEAVGIVSFAEAGKLKEKAAMEECNRKIAEFQEHSDSLRRGTQRLIWSQAFVIGVSAIVASFGGYAVAALKCGKYIC